jgi:hypothetical protein
MALQSLQAPLEVARIDRPEKDLNEPRQTAPFVGRDCAVAGCSDDRGHRARKIRGIAHRRSLNGATRSRRGGAMRSRHIRNAVVSPSRASSTALTRQGLRLAV